MATTKKSSKAKAKSSAKSSKPAKAAHKKVVARKVVRKSAVKHAAKATRPAAARGDSDYTKFSGKFTVRLPKSLHQALVDRADREGVSLNLFVTNALSRTVAVAGKKR